MDRLRVNSETTNALKVVVVGQGYVGLPLAMLAVEKGHNVVGFDVDVPRVESLQKGISFVEDISNAEVAAALAAGRYVASYDPTVLEGFDVIAITVPTPLRETLPDLSFIESAGQTLAPYLRRGATVVLESTTYPGTTEDLLGGLLDRATGMTAGVDYYLGYSPERIDPGNPKYGLRNTHKVVSGVNAESLRHVQGFYDSVLDADDDGNPRTVAVSTPKEAELAKLLENTFRHVNIALVNELAMFGHDLGINVWEAIDAAATKPFGFMKFTPGPGVGGHCLPIDPSYLSWQVKRSLGRTFRFVELANDINEHMPNYVTTRLMTALNRKSLAVNGARVLLLGLTYKANTSDARESPAIAVAELLLEMGADLRAADPHISEAYRLNPGITLVELTDDEVRNADAVVLLTDHASFDLDHIASLTDLLLDTRNKVSGPSVDRL